MTAEIVLIRYTQDPPADAALRTALGLHGRDYLYVVANGAMERLRMDIAPRVQLAAMVRGGREAPRPQLVFHKVLRHLMGRPLLTRAEERVLLSRVVSTVAQDDHEVEQQLRHDVFAWRDALADLAARGVNLERGFPAELSSQLVNPGVGRILESLQREYLRLQRQHGKTTFEESAYDFLRTQYNAPAVIVMEGFTYLTPLQRYFLEQSLRQNATVYLIFPHRQEQLFGYQIMERTYEPWWSTARTQTIPTATATPPSTLQHVQALLFADNSITVGAADDTLIIECFPHRHQEIASCLERVQQLLAAGTEPQAIAIVTRDAAAFASLLQEEAEMREQANKGLRDATGRLVTLGIQPRMLLLTPLGRFALALYEIWDGQGLAMDAEHFASILASGWLGARRQMTTDLFTSLRAQIFEQCISEQDWRSTLDDLRAMRHSLPASSRLPAAVVDDETIDFWRDTIAQVVSLCRYLFAVPDQSISEHIRRLLDALSRLDPARLRESEVEVLRRITDALQQLGEGASLAMSAREFGDVLSSLVRDYQQAERETEGEMPLRPDQIWLTTPEGIDGYRKQVVLALGLDNRRVPRRYSDPWPFYAPDVDAHIELERYLFLTVVRAAQQKLYLSYSEADEDGSYRSSPYLDALTSLGVQETPRRENESSSEPVASVRGQTIGRARRRRYDLAEIAHFALCPFRYKLERLGDKRARPYRGNFQLQFLAQALWLHLIFEYLEASRLRVTGRDALRQAFITARNQTQPQMEGIFPAFRALQWFAVTRQVDAQLDHFATEWTKGERQYPVQLFPARPSEYEVIEGDRATAIAAPLRHALHKGIFDYPQVNDLQGEEWLAHGIKPDTQQGGPSGGSNQDDGADRYSEVSGTAVFRSQYDAVQWWRHATEAAFFYRATRDQNTNFAQTKAAEFQIFKGEIAEWIKRIEAGEYPKHPGDHCIYCPARADCLGLPEEAAQ